MQSDWRDKAEGLVPSPRAHAMLDWVESAHPDWWAELRQITFAMTDSGNSPETVQAFDSRIEGLHALWRKAGQPDPRGRLLHRPGDPAGRIQH